MVEVGPVLKDLIEHGAVRIESAERPRRRSRRPDFSLPIGRGPRGPRDRAGGGRRGPDRDGHERPRPDRRRSTATRWTGSGPRWRPGPASTTRVRCPAPSRSSTSESAEPAGLGGRATPAAPRSRATGAPCCACSPASATRPDAVGRRSTPIYRHRPNRPIATCEGEYRLARGGTGVGRRTARHACCASRT